MRELVLDPLSLSLSPEEARALVARCREPVYRVAARLLGDEAEAEDVAQEVLLQLLRTRAGLRPGSDEGAWAYAITVNRCRDILKSHRVRHTTLAPPEGFGGEDPRPAPDVALDQARLEQRLRAALQRLPPTYRAVLVLHDMEGQPYRRMCEILQSNETTLKARVIRARRALARALTEGEP